MAPNLFFFFILTCSSRHAVFLCLLSLESSLLAVLWELDELGDCEVGDCEVSVLRFDVLCEKRFLVGVG